MCATLLICSGASGGSLESAVGRGDSGGAAFTDTWEVLGVASWGQGNAPGGNLNGYNAVFGYACVANFAANAACKGNFDFVTAQVGPSQVIPEPSTYALMATGLIGLAGFARRRRN
jgi:PPE-repeat protein